jgi:hypothetical protein
MAFLFILAQFTGGIYIANTFLLGDRFGVGDRLGVGVALLGDFFTALTRLSRRLLAAALRSCKFETCLRIFAHRLRALVDRRFCSSEADGLDH